MERKGFDPNIKSHFINIPIEDPSFVDAYSKFCSDIKSCNLNDFHPELLQKPGKLHMTVCTLDLGEDQDKIQRVNEIMTNINKEIATIAGGKVIFNFEKFEAMGNIKSSRVVYAKMLEDENFIKLSEIIHLIIKTLIDENILDVNKLDDLHITYDKNEKKYKITLHLTLINVLFLNKIERKMKQKKPTKSINATAILEYMNQKPLPFAEITQVNFSRMREDKKTEKYELLYPYSFI